MGLGVEPQREVRLRLANRIAHVQQLGRVFVELDGIEELTFVVFDEPDSPPTIGAVTLETSLLGVVPVSHRLAPVEGWQASAGCPSSVSSGRPTLLRSSAYTPLRRFCSRLTR